MTDPKRLDRSQLHIQPLAKRANKLQIERDHIRPDQQLPDLEPWMREVLDRVIERVVAAREADRPVMLTFGAHTIKNGLAPVLIDLMRRGWLTHLATNGAGIIHDWEFAWLGESSEDVRGGVARGEFGIWRETGYYLNLGLLVGAWEGLGYGAAIGKMIATEGLDIPGPEALLAACRAADADPERAACAADLLVARQRCELPSGNLEIPHPYGQYSAQAAAWDLGVPFTAHPMFGHDIIYTHPLSNGGAVGHTAERDFLCFAGSVSGISGGVYLSLGSAVMSPMVFEKSMSMAQNLAQQRGESIHEHSILVVDLRESSWDWRQGEPPEDHPDYYLRYNKTFNRMGGQMDYLSADNRAVLLYLAQALPKIP